MSFQPISERLVRALSYVNIANRGGSGPTPDELIAFVDNPRSSLSQTLRGSMQRMIAELAGEAPVDDVPTRMSGLGWARQDAGQRLTLTDLGRAVLRGLRLEETEQVESEAVIIGPDNPLQYAMLTRVVAEAGAGLLCDPYFKPDMLQWLSSSTSISRVLVTRPRPKKEREEQDQLFPIFLGAYSQAGRIEIRITEDKSFHDRGLVHENGDVSLLGTSLTGIGTHLTAVVPLPDVAGRPWREHAERVWGEATPVVPTVNLRAELPATPGEPETSAEEPADEPAGPVIPA
ncbi:hypothetical protein V2J52_02825 [Georgenia sp. MJ173]|uniref:hypothetical protein n=1 Tax=Georgenia sunbinii TaxID=3117728 RepID=UPI002F264AA7